jgi:hypothetical protein
VIDLKRLGNGKIRTILSDGTHFIMGMFATQLTQVFFKTPHPNAPALQPGRSTRAITETDLLHKYIQKPWFSCLKAPGTLFCAPPP